MKTKIYGAYGSNTHIEQMAHRCPMAKVIGTGWISNYHLTFRGTNSGVANIEYHRGKKVPVLLWDITKDCENSLDRYEGYPSLYVKKDIEAKLENGDKVVAMFYVMAQQYESCPAEPSRYYLNTIWNGYQQNKMPVSFLRQAVKETADLVSKIADRRCW